MVIPEANNTIETGENITFNENLTDEILDEEDFSSSNEDSLITKEVIKKVLWKHMLYYQIRIQP